MQRDYLRTWDAGAVGPLRADRHVHAALRTQTLRRSHARIDRTSVGRIPSRLHPRSEVGRTIARRAQSPKSLQRMRVTVPPITQLQIVDVALIQSVNKVGEFPTNTEIACGAHAHRRSKVNALRPFARSHRVRLHSAGYHQHGGKAQEQHAMSVPARFLHRFGNVVPGLERGQISHARPLYLVCRPLENLRHSLHLLGRTTTADHRGAQFANEPHHRLTRRAHNWRGRGMIEVGAFARRHNRARAFHDGCENRDCFYIALPLHAKPEPPSIARQ